MSKVRAGRVLALAEDFERLEAMGLIPFRLRRGAAGPLPACSPRCGSKKPGPAGLHPQGRSACGGRRRPAILVREEFGPHPTRLVALGWGPRGKIVGRSRCR